MHLEHLTLKRRYSHQLEMDEEIKLQEETKQILDKTNVYGLVDSRSGYAEETGTGNLKDDYEEPSRIRLGLTLTACFFLLVSSAGTHVSLGVIYVELISFFESPRSQTALVQSVFGGFSFGGGILFTSLILRYEAGLVVVFSSLVGAVSFCASVFAPNILVIILLVGVVSGLASGLNVLVSYIVVGWTFQKWRKAALSALVAGSAFGQIVMPLIAEASVNQYAWKGAISIIGSLLFLNCVPCGLVIYYARNYFQRGDDSKISTGKLVDAKCLTDAVYMIYLMSFVFALAFNVLEPMFVVDMAVSKGMTEEAGATLLSAHGLTLLASRFLGMIWLGLVPDTHLVLHLIYIFLGLAISRIVLSEAHVFWGMLLGIILRGLTGGLVFAFNSGVLVDMRGLELFPQSTALSNCLGGVVSAMGGYIGGLSYDLTGSYRFQFFLAAGCNLYSAISMVLIFLIYRCRQSMASRYAKL